MTPAHKPTYLNPVYRHACPDPFVLKHRGEYWAYCTGFCADGRCFSVLHSPDLIHWRMLGGAMPPLPGGHSCYWAPEVLYDNGRFYLYYSVGNEERMQIRVAVSEHPAGPYIDSDQRLTHEPFAIDAHIFTDEDGSHYLFYATDFLDTQRIGTGTVMDRLLDPLTPVGTPRPVTRALYDWQVYDPHRREKGGARWHTLEGPFVLKRKARYYQMFSGGNWQNPSYGVSYAVSEQIEARGEWEQAADGVHTFPILRSRPEQGVIGPGHNSVVRGPDNRQPFCIYHRWVDDAAPDPIYHATRLEAELEGAGALQEAQGALQNDPGALEDAQGTAPGRVEQPCLDSSAPLGPVAPQPARVMAIDRLEFIGDRMAILGPTNAPQPFPHRPALSFFRGYGEAGGMEPAGFPQGWSVSGGRWGVVAGQAVQQDTRPGELSEARLPLPDGPFLLEVSIQALSPTPRGPGAYGLLLLDGEGNEAFSLELLPRARGADRPETGTATGMVVTGSGEERKEQTLALPRDFSSSALHLFRLELDGRRASLSVDGVPRWKGRIQAPTATAILFTRSMAAGFSAFELTSGWEDLFWQSASDPAGLGWETAAGDWVLQDGQLRHANPEGEHALIVKSPILNDVEMVANLRLAEPVHPDCAYGLALVPVVTSTGSQVKESSLLVLEPLLPDLGPQRWSLVARTPHGRQAFPLPEGFDPTFTQQVRLTKRALWLTIQWEADLLGEIPVSSAPIHVGLYAHRADLRVDMVRVTALSEFCKY